MEATLHLPGLMKGSSLSSGRAKAKEERALTGDGSYIASTRTWLHEGILAAGRRQGRREPMQGMEAILHLPGFMKGSSLSSGRAKAKEERALAGLENKLNLPGLMKGSSLSSGRAKAGEEGPGRGM